MMKFLALMCATAAAASAQSIPAGTSSHSITHGLRSRSFTVNNPGGNATGMFMVFHGWTQTAGSICRMSDAASIGRDTGFVTVCPQGVGNSWNAGACCAGNTQDDVGFARGVVDYVTNAIDVPADRIYTTGFSNGGMISYRLACEASDVFRGAAPAGGSYYGNQLGSFSCNPSAKRPILHGHGTLDTLQPFVAARNSYERYAEGIQGCPSQDSITYSNPAYFGMSCRERSPCDGGTASTFCTYTGMGHVWPANFLLRAINYFTTGSLDGDGSTPPEPPQDPPSITCDQCSAVHGSADGCGCGHCGSFGACTFSCDPTASLYSGTPCE